jgi:hypothetical protein
MTQQMPLFHEPKTVFTKLAAETTLPEDPNMWQDEVLQEVYKQVPYLADFNLEVVMETVDGERGYGLGHVEVMSKSEAPMTSPEDQQQAAGIRKARIPVIIKDGKLAPFDVVITDDAKAMPLTESRMRQAMFRPHAFDVTSKTPGDQSMIGQLYPPYRQNYGFGGGGVAMSAGMGGKTASKKIASLEGYLALLQEEHLAKTASAPAKDVKGTKVPKFEEAAAKDEKDSCGYKMGSILEAVLPTANISDVASFKESMLEYGVKEAYLLNAATYDAVELISKADPPTLEKRAAAIMSRIKPSVVQVVKLASGGYTMKTASHHTWAPVVEHMDRGELVRRVGVKIALATDTAGAVTVGGEDGVSEETNEAAPAAGPISSAGMYSVKTVDGADLTGVVIPNLVDIDGKALPISLFTDGKSAAVQSDMVGVPVGEYSPPPTVPAEQAQGHGCFYMEYGGIPCATLPLTLGAVLAGNGVDDMPKFDAETFDGRPVQVSVQPYAQQILNVEGLMIIPQGWTWLPLDQAAEVELAENGADIGKTASLQAKLASVEVSAGGPDSFSVRGFAVEKLALDERQFLNQDDCLFLLTGLGTDPGYALKKMAQAYGKGPQQVRIGHTLKLAHEVQGQSYVNAAQFLESVPVYRHRMWKEAAALPDPIAVDSVLSLGFINPENLATYIGYLPTLDEAQRRLCELLIGARLGMRELSEGAIERAIRALEDVIEGLKVIAFQG